MKIICTFLMICIVLCVSRPSHAAQTTSGFVEVQSRADWDQGRHKIQLDTLVNHTFTDLVGINVWSVLGGSWGEILVGPTLSPGDGAIFGLSLGGEQGPSKKLTPRYAVWSLFVTDGFCLFAWGEANNDALAGKDDLGFWYNLIATYSPVSPIALGFQLRRPDGAGPRVSWKMGGVQTWVAWTPLLPETGTWRPGRIVSGIQLLF